jgi:L-aminopeptidase/D-esterase-like protein
VLLAERPVVAAVDVRGGAPGTRETDLLRPDCLVERVDAIVLSGGSVLGLAAADGVVDWLHAQGRGFPVAGERMPIVPAAIVFDFPIGGARDWPEGPPYRALALSAAGNAGSDFVLGNAGAGLGARAGSLKGGLGSVSAVAEDGLVVGALAVANPAGSVVMGEAGTMWAWDVEQAGELGGQKPPAAAPVVAADLPPGAVLGGNTTLAVVATNLALDKAQAGRLAIMAQDGLARAIRPAHTPFDGDTVFVLATGEKEPGPALPETLTRAGAMAADCTARAIARAVFEADGLGTTPAYRQRHADAFKQ